MKLINKYKIIFFSLAVLFLLASCAEEKEPFDSPFVYLTDRFGGISASMDSEARYTATYYVRLSSKQRTEKLDVNYKFVAGDGLQEGLDYTLPESNVNPIVFEPGVYEKTIQISWLPKKLDGSKNNTLKIVLVSASDPSVTVGRIGPDKLGSEYVITKE